MIFIKDLKWASHVSERFRDALEDFLPKWIESLLPYYQEGKEQGVDLFKIVNCLPNGRANEEIVYEHNGIAYYQHHWPSSSITTLGFDSQKGYRKCNWLECFCEFIPGGYDTASRENLDNYLWYNTSFYRCYNRKPEYCDVAKRCDDYFRQLTGDPTVGLSLSGTSMIYYNDSAKLYIDRYCALE